MQRCPYLHEMKERLLIDKGSEEPLIVTPPTRELTPRVQALPTIVQCNADGFGSHTSLTSHTRLPPGDGCLLDTCPLSHQAHHPKNAKTSLFIVMSFIYAKLLVVICIAYVISDVVTHNIPHYYYEGFFTYLFGMSILFLLYCFCFLLTESSCCSGGGGTPQQPKPVKPKPVKEKKPKKEKPVKEKKGDKKDGGTVPPAPPPAPDNKGALSGVLKELKKGEGDGGRQDAAEKLNADPEDGRAADAHLRKRKTSHNLNSHGSFFLRVGAIVVPTAAFGLGTMIYNGLEIGKFLEIPMSSPCFLILQGVNPLLQMIFTFMQMYFIFMNARLNIHRFKLVARFGLMHVAATNLCVWIRTLVVESLKEITNYHLKHGGKSPHPITDSVREHALRNSATVLGTRLAQPDVAPALVTAATTTAATLNKLAYLPPTTTTKLWRAVTSSSSPVTRAITRAARLMTAPTTTTTTTTTTTSTTTTTTPASTTTSTTTAATPLTTSTLQSIDSPSFFDWGSASGYNGSEPVAWGDEPRASALLGWGWGWGGAGAAGDITPNSTSCDRVNIMGSIVTDASPYLYPCIITYSLIGAAVIYVMWRHIGRNPRYWGTEELEKRLESIMSQRAVALARASHGRVDCVGASKGLFFGLLLLVGALISLILYFVFVQHKPMKPLAIYLADASHCALLLLSILAICIGFCRVQNLKFKTEEPSDLNDILLRVSAFGLLLYAVFSVIAGALNALTKEANLLVTVTGLLVILQVIVQLMFIADVSRRRVHLPEQDRSKPGRQIVTFLLILNVTMWIIYTFEAQKVLANPVQLDYYGFLSWSLIQRVTLPLCVFHRFHSAVTLAEIWKTTYKSRIE